MKRIYINICFLVSSLFLQHRLDTSGLDILQQLLNQGVDLIRLLGQRKVLGVDHDPLEVGHILIHILGLVGLQVRVTQGNNDG